MARRQHQNSISLFPFLAVLVCAMGALILLLLVMTRKIRQEQQHEQVAVVTTSAATVSLPDRSAEIEDLEIRIRGVQEAMAAKQSQAEALQVIVHERRVRVASLQQELEDLKQRLTHDESGNLQTSVAETLTSARQLNAREAALLRQLNESEKQLLEKQQLLVKATDASREAQLILQKKNSALVSLRTQVSNAQEKQTRASGTATLLEFSNSTGTTRTPIVVDVSDRGFEILPNGIAISAADMEGFPVRDNPLLSAILTSHRHRSKNSLTDEPYVLMLVRPDGCLAFYGAQRILMEAGIHYGYELLEPDREIVAGDIDPSETSAVRAAMDEAFRRRENLYAKLMAIAQQRGGLRGSNGEPQTGSGERRMAMRPDGRIVVDENSGQRPLDGRFFAGGVAPPASLRRNRPVGGYRGLNPDRLSPDDAEKLADEFAERYAKQQVAARSAANATASSDRMAQPQNPGPDDSFGSPGEREFAEALAGRDGSLQSSRPAGVGGVGASGDGPHGVGPHGDGQNGSGQTLGTPAPGGLAEQSHFATTSGNPGHASSSIDQPLADETLADETLAGTTSPDSSFTTQATKPGTNSEESDWIQSSLLSGDAGGSTSTASQPKKAKSGSPAKSLLFAGEPGDAPSTGMPDLSRIDPDLLRRLQTGKQQSGSLSTPVGIVVFLDAHHMTIGQQAAIAVTPESLDAAFATLLEGIHTEVQDARRKPNEPMMPIVKFIVSPGGEQWRIPLSHSLKRMGIHTAAIFELTPYITSSDRTGRARMDDHDVP